LSREKRKGSKDQLIGLNLWVVCVFIGYIIFLLFMESPIGFLLAFGALLIFLVGLFRIFRGLYLITKGTPPKRGKWLGSLGGFMLGATPLALLLSVVTPYPLNYIVFQMTILLFLCSFVIPYMAHKGKSTGLLSNLGAL